MRWTVNIDGRIYTPLAAGAALAVKRAMEAHDKHAKERKKLGYLTPVPCAKKAHYGLRIYVTATREPKK
jgi:hypothetical protein